MNNKIVITTGDPNGIGAEITIKALKSLQLPKDKVVLVSNKTILDSNNWNGNYEVIEIPYFGTINEGCHSKAGGEFSFLSLKKACELKPKAIVTAPVSKESLHLAGHLFNGQTEILEYFLARPNQKAEMLFTGDKFKILLLTRHVALNKVTFTQDDIISKITRLQEFFTSKLKIKNPKFGLCALNPHAGENGVIGKEELEIMYPAVNILKKRGIDISDPISADTLLPNAIKQYLKGEPLDYDCYIATYHDQGLIPIKAVAQENTVNMTIGLDIIRTSPSHGTAFDIAGKNIASPEPMISAIKQALEI